MTEEFLCYTIITTRTTAMYCLIYLSLLSLTEISKTQKNNPPKIPLMLFGSHDAYQIWNYMIIHSQVLYSPTIPQNILQLKLEIPIFNVYYCSIIQFYFIVCIIQISLYTVLVNINCKISITHNGFQKSFLSSRLRKFSRMVGGYEASHCSLQCHHNYNCTCWVITTA